ncbi:uroporphyrinogen-III C-methyltransferase [Simiduia sp. 21SJ11W-1]|uniref:uroporphyrinogen-III C-methyltransferase n=1 Tax=Simiduia sp. 21SJ11W-1 TaxID=2909669 RepID=UPI00209CB057|nr:uroporphyrinogen-III C-methyltransferase [Simiduia sp. 21SJ11W-1]UTA47776.1 uroporphyrinogen-III C-methyltransferase [Simiduia sp. 21SJ11W-1]
MNNNDKPNGAGDSPPSQDRGTIVAETNTPIPAPTQAKAQAKPTVWPLWLALLAVLAASAAGGHWLWGQMQLQAGAQADEVAKLTAQAEQWRAEQRQLSVELAQSLSRFEAAQSASERVYHDFTDRVEAQLAAQSQQLAQMTAASRTQFLLNEAQFLVRQASQRLQLERAATSAVGLFELADQLLAQVQTELGNPAGLMATRGQLAKDLAQLKRLQAVDYTGVFFALDAILVQVDELALGQPPREFANEEVEPAVIRKNPDRLWAEITIGWRNFTRQLASYVRVKRLEKPVEPLLSPDQEIRVRENLKLKLQVAQLALLRADGKLYGANLALARQWLEEYFPVSFERNHMMEQLDELAARSVNSELPDLSGTVQSLDQFISQYRLTLGVRP